jgi:4-carboxymuconolactone decarboxylase
MPSPEEAFRRLSIGDLRLIDPLSDFDSRDLSIRRLDDRTESLLRVGVLVALDGPETSYQTAVGAAQRAGADLGEFLAVLGSIAGLVGSARVLAAAPRIALAAGYDVGSALEANDPFDHEPLEPRAHR